MVRDFEYQNCYIVREKFAKTKSKSRLKRTEFYFELAHDFLSYKENPENQESDGMGNVQLASVIARENSTLCFVFRVIP